MSALPSRTARRLLLARHLRQQASHCAAVGSPLYGSLLASLGGDVDERAPELDSLLTLCGRDIAEPSFPLRLMGAIHRLVLTGRAPALAGFYPSVGGHAPPSGAAPALRTTVAANAEVLVVLAQEPVQTNEVQRSAPIALALGVVSAETGLPVSILEVGASAGLNLCLDRYRIESSGWSWGPADAPLELAFASTGTLPRLERLPQIVARRGCDRNPLDPRSAEDRLLLESFVWADQVDRLRLLSAALDVAADADVTVDRADAGDWLPAQLARRREGAVTAIVHSFVLQYMSRGARRRFAKVIQEAAVTQDAPLAEVGLEWTGSGVELTLTLWPGGRQRTLALTDSLGTHVEWLDGANRNPPTEAGLGSRGGGGGI